MAPTSVLILAGVRAHWCDVESRKNPMLAEKTINNMTHRDIGQTWAVSVQSRARSCVSFHTGHRQAAFWTSYKTIMPSHTPPESWGTSDRAERQGCQPGRATEHLLMTGGLNGTRPVPSDLQTRSLSVIFQYCVFSIWFFFFFAVKISVQNTEKLSINEMMKLNWKYRYG